MVRYFLYSVFYLLIFVLTCKSYVFPGSHFRHNTNNILESLNSVLQDIRQLLPLQMVDAIYTYLIKTIYNQYHSKHQTDKVPDKLLIKFNKWYANS